LVVTARFRILYVFALMEVGRGLILHFNVTDHPSSDWTQQQLREALPGDHPFRFIIHDWESISSQQLDQGIATMGVRCFGSRRKRPKQIRFANVWSERSAGSVWISFHRWDSGI
jgi:hypothetical protein